MLFADDIVLIDSNFDLYIKEIADQLKENGHHVLLVNSHIIFGVYVPASGKYKLSFGTPGKIIDIFDPDFIHIFTSGFLGSLARRACIKRKLKFTTTYAASNVFFPKFIFKFYLKWFHSKSQKVLKKNLSLDFIDNLVLAK